MHEFAKTLFQVLRKMDSEAAVTAKRSPTGLNWYGGHYEPEKKRPRSEVCWSLRLAELLPEHGYPTRAEVPYKSLPRCKCDDVITLKNGQTLWLENKGAWKDYWVKQRKLGIYRSYLLHPLLPGLDASKTHTVPLDLQKLAILEKPEADHVGLLLLGFDTNDAPMAADVADLVRLAGFDRTPWTAASDHWPDPHRTGGNVCCWLWSRPTT